MNNKLIKFQWMYTVPPKLVDYLIKDVTAFMALRKVANDETAIYFINGRQYSSIFYHFIRLTQLEDKYNLFELACFFALLATEGGRINKFQETILSESDLEVSAKFKLKLSKERVLKYSKEFMPKPFFIKFGDDPRKHSIYIEGIKEYGIVPFFIPNYTEKTIEEIFETQEEYFQDYPEQNISNAILR